MDKQSFYVIVRVDTGREPATGPITEGQVKRILHKRLDQIPSDICPKQMLDFHVRSISVIDDTKGGK